MDIKRRAGKPIRTWDSRGHTFRTEYDPLRRPLRSFVTGADLANPDQELMTERLVYGEQHPQAVQRNILGILYLQLDQSGAIITEEQDFKGNPLRATRRIATEYKQSFNWHVVEAALPTNATTTFVSAQLEAALAPLLEAETYTSQTTYDALNRPLTLTTPHTATMQPNIIRPGYNEANLLERVDVRLPSQQQNGQPQWTPFITNIDYDAKGQRQRIDYGNGVTTRYDYDPLTFRLKHLFSHRNATRFPADCLQPAATDWPGCQVQNLHYTYDPAGNITHIRDDAQQTIYFSNQRVEPSAEYTYDAIYRLIEAAGREHLGQAGGTPIPHSHNDAPRVGLLHPGDGNAMGTYIERYVYDAVGNFLEMQHRGSASTQPGWTRSYAYNETSLIESGSNGTQFKMSNRLSRTTIGSGNPTTEFYAYDAHGNMLTMNHLSMMQWDYRDQLQATAKQVINNGDTPEVTYYVYDAAGERVRKITEQKASAGETPGRKEERLYLGGFEIYRAYENDGETVALERETLHIMDDKQRIALVETRTTDLAGNDPSPKQLIRYQFANHLGSASLELDDQAQIISYEEYTPYGSTSYQAVRSQTEGAKRYRYSGKERDEESGFYYHGARYYAAWIGRWVAADPAGLIDGPSCYWANRDNPVANTDSTGCASENNLDPQNSLVTGNATKETIEVDNTGSDYTVNIDPLTAVVEIKEGDWLTKIQSALTGNSDSERAKEDFEVLVDGEWRPFGFVVDPDRLNIGDKVRYKPMVPKNSVFPPREKVKPKQSPILGEIDKENESVRGRIGKIKAGDDRVNATSLGIEGEAGGGGTFGSAELGGVRGKIPIRAAELDVALDTPKVSGGIYLGHMEEKGNGDIEATYGIEALGSILELSGGSKTDDGMVGVGGSIGLGAGAKVKVSLRSDKNGIKSVTVDLEGKFIGGAAVKFTVPVGFPGR